MPRPQPIVVPHAPMQNMKSFEGNVDLKSIMQAIMDIKKMREESQLKAEEPLAYATLAKFLGIAPEEQVTTYEPKTTPEGAVPPLQTPEQEGDLPPVSSEIGFMQAKPTTTMQPPSTPTMEGIQAMMRHPLFEKVIGHLLPKAEKEVKEFNIQGDLDSFLASKSGEYEMDYATPEGRMGMLNIFGSIPELGKEFQEWRKSQYYTFVPTSEGIKAYNARTGKLTGETIGDKPLTGEMITAETVLKEMKSALEEVKRTHKSNFVGPIMGGLVGGIGEATVGLSSDETAFRTANNQIFNLLGQERGGKVLTANEIQRLKKELMSPSQPSSTYEGRMKGFERLLNSLIEERAKASGGYGTKLKTGKQPDSDKAKAILKKWGVK